MTRVRTRFAPSPTGFLHIGSLRTALYAYALAKHKKGDFILRIEDTDQKREIKGAIEALQETLKKFGLNWDEFYVQSDRLGNYQSAAEKLVEDGNAFYCDCKARNAKEEGFSKELKDPCRNKNLTTGAIKLKVPNGKTITYFDFVHKKEISWSLGTVYDATLLKSDGFPTYHLAAMVDDIDMKISHLLRGHDWLPSTPIHLLVFDFLGGKRPEIGHLTDILSSETGKKLSKRRDSVFAEQFLKEGYLPEALLNCVMLLGWAPKDNRELFTLEGFVKAFDINGFQEANPRFFKDKLDWFNQHYIKEKYQKNNGKEFASYIGTASVYVNTPNFKNIVTGSVSYMPSRMNNIQDYDKLMGYVFETSDKIEPPTSGTSNYDEHLSKALDGVNQIPTNNWTLEKINETFSRVVKENHFKIGDFYMDLRTTISGVKFTPPLNETLVPIGKKSTIERLKRGLERHINS